MRISEINTRLQGVNVEKSLPTFSASNSSWLNVERFRKLVVSLKDIPGLEAISAAVLDCTFPQGRSGPQNSKDSQDEINSLLASYRTAVQTLRQAAADVAPKVSADSISIRLPDSRDYQGIVEDQASLATALQQALATGDLPGAVIEIEGWEADSLWLHLFLGTPLAVRYVGRIAWAGAVVRKKELEGVVLLEQVRGLKIKEDSLRDIAVANKRELDAILETEAAALFEQTFGSRPHGEYFQKLKETVRTLSTLIGRGAEVHASSLAPEETKSLFPAANPLDAISSRISQPGETGKTTAADQGNGARTPEALDDDDPWKPLSPNELMKWVGRDNPQPTA